MEDKLRKYVNGELRFTPFINISQGDGVWVFLKSLGEYIYDKIDIENHLELKFYTKLIKKEKKKILKFKILSAYTSLSIHFLSSVLNIDALTSMFGEGIYHDEFGEGFDGEYDEETDEYGEPDVKESFISWMIELNGILFHMGVDHRGTSVEVNVPNIGASYSSDFKNEVRIALEELVDRYADVWKKS